MDRVTKFSYLFIALTLGLVGGLHLATPFIAVLFGYFALSKLSFGKQKWLAIVLFLALVLGVFYGFVHYFRHAIRVLPRIAENSIPSIIDYANAHGVELPFTDLDSLKSLVKDSISDELKSIGNFARLVTKEFVFLVIGFVVAISLFLNAKMDLERDRHPLKNNLYSRACDEISERFRAFYHSFAIVMGAQLIISAINTALTSIFIISVSLPHPGLVITVTFLCGLLPIIGNLISNITIVAIAFTVSPRLALAALVFLIVVHKLEYFLNSKIIGERIKNPVWLTLLALILGERLMGIPGMILAPVVLNYIKVETTRMEALTLEKTKDSTKRA